jgi:TonB family protein
MTGRGIAAALLAMAAAAGAAPAQPTSIVRLPVPAPPMPPALPESARRYPLLAAAPADWPQARPAGIASGPDWSDYNIYPAAALRREQEGRVGIALLVGADGIPRACRITIPSGHVELDDGTCDLGLTMRFRPALAADGRPAESVHRTRILWRLTDPTELAPARMTALISVRDGRVADCRAAGDGPIAAAMARDACRFITAETGHFLGAGHGRAQRATVAVTLRPAGDASAWPAPAGRLVAERRTEFRLTPNGDLVGCHATVDRGFGPLRHDYSGPCGFFLNATWLEPGPAAQGGALDVAVYIER